MRGSLIKKRCMIISLVLTFCISFLNLINPGSPAGAAEPIKIGAIISITGWAGSLGTGQKEAYEVLVDDINKKGGVLGRQIEVYIEDDKSVPTNALIAATKLVKDKKVCALLGPTITDSGMAVIPMADEEKIPYVVLGPIVTPLKKWVFLTGPGDARAATHIVEYAVKSLRAKKIAVLYVAENYGMTGYKIMQNEIMKYPEASIVIAEKLESKDTNMIPQLMKIKAANPDLLIPYAAGAPTSIIAKNYKQLGMTTPVLAPGAVPMPDFLKLAGNIAEEAKWIFLGFPLIVAEQLPATDPFRKNLYDPFKIMLQDKFGKEKILNVFHVGPYDGLGILLAAIKQAGSDNPAAIRDALEKVKFNGFLGPYGATATDHQGSQVDTEIMMTLKNGRMVPYKK
jgi:branched-chain amino acid transport system substrate-binding protein